MSRAWVGGITGRACGRISVRAAFLMNDLRRVEAAGSARMLVAAGAGWRGTGVARQSLGGEVFRRIVRTVE